MRSCSVLIGSTLPWMRPTYDTRPIAVFEPPRYGVGLLGLTGRPPASDCPAQADAPAGPFLTANAPPGFAHRCAFSAIPDLPTQRSEARDSESNLCAAFQLLSSGDTTGCHSPGPFPAGESSTKVTGPSFTSPTCISA